MIRHFTDDSLAIDPSTAPFFTEMLFYQAQWGLEASLNIIPIQDTFTFRPYLPNLRDGI